MKKVLYQKDIFIHNKYFDRINNNKNDYDLNYLFEIAYYSLAHRYELLDYILKKAITTSIEDITLFNRYLKDYLMYDEYINHIVNSKDNFLKTCLVLYLDKSMKDELFKDNDDLINAILSSNEIDKLRITNLLNVSSFKCSDDCIKTIKSNFKDLLFEYYKSEPDYTKEIILNNYYEIIDNNQKNLEENSKILIKI